MALHPPAKFKRREVATHPFISSTQAEVALDRYLLITESTVSTLLAHRVVIIRHGLCLKLLSALFVALGTNLKTIEL